MKTQYRHIIVLFAVFFLTANPLFADELRERVYIHTDKQLYLAGELLWMKMYVTDTEGKPLPFSKVGYVELLEEATPQVQVKLDVQHAVGEGWMEIPSNLPTGYYRLVAYTRNMKNEGEQVFFRKTIGIINTFRTDKTVHRNEELQAPEPDLLDNNLSVSTERRSYSTRSQGNIQIKGLPEGVHSLSLSVAGKDLVAPENSMNIIRWHNQLAAVPKPPLKNLFTPEYEGHIIHGQVRNIQTNEPAGYEVIFPLGGFVGDRIRLFGGQPASDGSIAFYTCRIKGMHEFATTSFTPMENKFRIDIESPFSTHTAVQALPFEMNPSRGEELTDRSVGLQVLHAFSADSMNRMDTTYAHFQWVPDRSYILDEYTRFTRMDEIVIEFIPSLRFRRFEDKRLLSVLEEEGNAFSYGNSLVILDGIPITDHELIYKYDPLLIYKIDVYKSKFIFGGQYFNGMVFISTYNNDYPTLVLDDNTQIFDYEGTQAHRNFYVPSYNDEAAGKNHIPDYRHTLLWQPEVSANGQSSLTIPFTTSDLTGEFRITIEGITKNGKPIRGTARFGVE